MVIAESTNYARGPKHLDLLLVDLGQNFGISDEKVFLRSKCGPSVLVEQAGRRRQRELTSSPTLMLLPPQPGRRTLSPGLTLVGTSLPSLSATPGPAAMTLASGRGDCVAAEGRKMPDAVFCSGLKRWTRMRSSSGTTDLMLRIVDCYGEGQQAISSFSSSKLASFPTYSGHRSCCGGGVDR